MNRLHHPTQRGEEPVWLVVLGIAVVVLVGAIVANIGTGFPWPSVTQPNGDLPDAVRDWLPIAAIAGSGSPTDSLETLAALHLDHITNAPYAHPRAPGALLLQFPLGMVEAEWAWPLMIGGGVIAVAVMSWAAVEISGISRWWIAPIGIAATLTTPSLAAMLVGSQAPGTAALVAITWLHSKEMDRPWGGVWLGLATVLKLFPGLLIPMLWMQGRRRTALGAFATFLLVNLAGLLLPEVTLVGALKTLTDHENGAFSHNLSLGLSLPGVAFGTALICVWARGKTLDSVMIAGSVAMLAMSPVVWNHYLIFWMVPAVVLATHVASRINRGARPLAESDRSRDRIHRIWLSGEGR